MSKHIRCDRCNVTILKTSYKKHLTSNKHYNNTINSNSNSNNNSNSNKVSCPCGKSILPQNMNRHLRSKFHLSHEQQPNNVYDHNLASLINSLLSTIDRVKERFAHRYAREPVTTTTTTTNVTEECDICFIESNKSNWYKCSTCRHEICNSCSSKVNRCPFCRSNIIITIY